MCNVALASKVILISSGKILLASGEWTEVSVNTEGSNLETLKVAGLAIIKKDHRASLTLRGSPENKIKVSEVPAHCHCHPLVQFS